MSTISSPNDHKVPRRRQASFIGGVGEPEVVPVQQIATLLQAWVDRWLITRPRPTPINPQEHEEREERNPAMGAIEWLKENSGVHERKIYGILRLEIPYVSLSHVDQLLVAMGMTYKYHTGEITVIPNPRWKTNKFDTYMSNNRDNDDDHRR